MEGDKGGGRLGKKVNSGLERERRRRNKEKNGFCKSAADLF